MALLTLQNAHLAFGLAPLLNGADFAIENRERIGLIGRNGAGKSSLLKVLARTQTLDDGAMALQGGLRITTAVSYTHLDVYKRQLQHVGHHAGHAVALLQTEAL